MLNVFLLCCISYDFGMFFISPGLLPILSFFLLSFFWCLSKNIASIIHYKNRKAAVNLSFNIDINTRDFELQEFLSKWNQTCSFILTLDLEYILLKIVCDLVIGSNRPCCFERAISPLKLFSDWISAHVRHNIVLLEHLICEHTGKPIKLNTHVIFFSVLH